MPLQFKCPHFAANAAGRHLQRSAEELLLEGRVDAVAAVVALGDFGLAVGGTQNAGALQHNLFALFHQRAGERGDHQRLRLRMALGVIRRLDSEHVACVLEDGVLKAATGPQEGNLLLSGVTDGVQHPFGICIRAGGDAPDALEIL